MSILQSTQFDIQTLAITTRDGRLGFDVRAIFEELNIFDNLLMPCMSGNIVIRDARGLASKLQFDGSEYIEIKIAKDLHNPESMFFKKRFVIYQLTDRKELNQKSEIYTLHFVSEEFILSQQVAQSNMTAALRKNKRVYVGSHYQNFDEEFLLEKTDEIGRAHV